MSKALENGVLIAFEVLLEEIEVAVDSPNKAGSEAFEKGDYQNAKDLVDKGSQMKAFRDKVLNLQKE